MAIREILTVPHPVLKQVSQAVDKVDDDLRALMDDMLETMYAAPGIGLAAVQVGDTRRIIVMDLGDREVAGDAPDEDASAEAHAAYEKTRRNPRYFVNPEILWTSEETAPYEEGCLSIPEYFDTVERPARCRLPSSPGPGRPPPVPP